MSEYRHDHPYTAPQRKLINALHDLDWTDDPDQAYRLRDEYHGSWTPLKVADPFAFVRDGWKLKLRVTASGAISDARFSEEKTGTAFILAAYPGLYDTYRGKAARKVSEEGAGKAALRSRIVFAAQDPAHFSVQVAAVEAEMSGDREKRHTAIVQFREINERPALIADDDKTAACWEETLESLTTAVSRMGSGTADTLALVARARAELHAIESLIDGDAQTKRVARGAALEAEINATVVRS